MIVRAAALVLLAASLPAAARSAGAQDAGDRARGQIKAQLESVRAPMFGGGKALPGVTATYSVATTGCRSSIDVAMPGHMVGTSSRAARIESVAIDWASVRSVGVAADYVVVAAATLPGGKRNFYAGSGASAARLKAAMDTLVGQCAASATGGPGVNLAALSDRVAEPADVLGNPRCRFRQIPGLLLTDTKPPAIKLAVWSASPREGGDKETRFDFSAQPGDGFANWRGILAISPALRFRDDRFRTHKIKTVLFHVDGRDPALSLRINQQGGNGAYSRYVAVVPDKMADETFFLERLERASTAVVRLFDTDGNAYGPWTYDVSTLRHVPAALKGARWSCR